MKKRVSNNVAQKLLEAEAKMGKRLTIAEWSEKIGISQTSFKNWRYNKTTRFDAPAIIAFAEYFGCTIGDLLVIEESPEGILIGAIA